MTATVSLTRNPFYEGAYLVYIAGVEAPIQAISVNMGVGGQMPTASIRMVPDPLLERFGAEDRVEVVAFYLDNVFKKFCLLFEGEILGWSYVNSPVGRTIEFTCGNFIRILNDLKPVFLTGPESMAMQVALPADAGAVEGQANPLTFPWNTFFYGIAENPETVTETTSTEETRIILREKPIRRPFDLLMNILDVCTGENAQKQCGSVVATNFFARYMRRVKFVNRFAPSPILEIEPLQNPDENAGVFPVLRAVRDDLLIRFLAQQGQQLGMNAPIWACVQQMFLMMYYEATAITTAPIAQMDRTPGSMTNGDILGPPRFLIKNTNEISAAQEKAIAAAESRLTTAADLAISTGATALSVEDVYAQLEEDIAAERQRILTASPQAPESVVKPNCILNYVTKPQWLFGIAPTCNIVFPSMNAQLSYDENYAAQPTRLYLNDMSYNDIMSGNSELIMNLAALRAGYPEQVQRELDKRYGVQKAGSSFDLRVSGKNFLVWPEEFFKGPVSSSQRLEGWFTLLANFVQNSAGADAQKAREADVQAKAAMALGEDMHQAYTRLAKEGKIPPTLILPGNQFDKAGFDKLLEQQRALETDNVVAIRQAYAKYEYFRQRAETRHATVVMTFNPYVVPGFPMVVFDSLTDGQHIVGYVADVSHSCTSSSWQTTVNLVHAQSLDEFVYEVYRARIGDTPEGVLSGCVAAPPNPIPTVRDVAQDLPRAEEYFSKLFHQNTTYPEGSVKRAAFDFTKAIWFVMPSGQQYPFDLIMSAQKTVAEVARREQETDAITAKIEADTEAYEAFLVKSTVPGSADAAEIPTRVDTYRQNRWAQYQEEVFRTRQETGFEQLVNTVLQNYVSVAPSPKFADIFARHDAAMQFISRPICSLEEYIDFRGSRGTRIGKVSATDPRQGKGAVYYEQILNLTPGPGPAPTFDENNNLVTPNIAELPDMRYDWATIIKKYRSKIIGRLLGVRSDMPPSKR